MNFVTYLYRKVPVPGTKNEVRWEYIKRINDFPCEIQ